MKVIKHVVSKETINIEIKEVTLLSGEEFVTNKDLIPACNQDWWLREYYDTQNGKEPDLVNNRIVQKKGVMLKVSSRSGSIVNLGGAVQSNPVYYAKNSIRPAIKFVSDDLAAGDKLELADHNWTVIADKIMLCDDCVGTAPFCANWDKENANSWDTSDAKFFVEEWAKKNKLI